jgi:LmbE family N-acetylglucosaminyl deacetylase
VKLPDRILFVGAHCDDVELLAGGLLFEACAAHRSVGVLVFSDHRAVLPEALAQASRAEMAANLAWLASETGTTPRDHTDAMIGACDGSFQARRAEVYARLESLRGAYDLVVTHPVGDTNQDHRQVAEEAQRVFKAHATVLAGEFPSNDVGEVRPAVFVPVSERAVAAKARMIETYVSQRRDGRPYLDGELARALARVRGSQIREPFAEAFEIGARLIARP